MMTKPNRAQLIGKLTRIRDVSSDLARELARDGHGTPATQALAAAVKSDVDVLLKALAPTK